jgi:hypothetical protein
VPGIKIDRGKLKVVLLAPTLHKPGIFVRLFSTQVEIAMCHNATATQQGKYVEQRHGVGTPTYSGYQHSALSRQPFLVDKGFYFLKHLQNPR